MMNQALSGLTSVGIDGLSLDQRRELMHRDMLSKVAHDLKTPLTSIIGSLQVYTVMRNAIPPDKQQELIGVALQEACRLDMFITNILDMAKLDNGMVRPKPSRVDLHTLLDQCLVSMRHHLRGSDVALADKVPAIVVTTDPALLGRALSLVLDNAVKYGGAPPTIRIDYGATDSVFIRIHDNGPGIPDDQHEAVFLKYTHLDHGREQARTGLGLGLAIARGMMQLLQGRITAANHPEGGAVVTVQLPL